MTDLDHDPAAFRRLPADARLYLFPTGRVNGPMADPGAARRLAGGPVWFGLAQLIARRGGFRIASILLPVAEVDSVLATLDEPHRARTEGQWRALTGARASIVSARDGASLRLDAPKVMGIINVTPDSFSDGGRFRDTGAAIDGALSMIEAGAGLIDIGGESTRPGAKPVWEGDEIARVTPVLTALQSSGAMLSLDTRKAAVMRAGLRIGVDVLNDVSALTFEPDTLSVAAAATCPVVLMHMQGTPETMQRDPRYADPLLDVYDWLEARVETVVAAGVSRNRILLDPGIGFGKTLRHNLALLNGLALLHALGCPLLVGVSRKRLVGALSREEPADQRLPGSIATALAALEQGAQIVRAHDVPETLQAVRVWQGLRDAGVTGG